jgi:hypothetical protein
MKFCIDKELPIQLTSRSAEAVTFPEKYWTNGQKLRVKFMEGTESQKQFVMNALKDWMDVVNLQFVRSEDVNSEIRVAFDENDGAWSYIGTDARDIPTNQPTLNLGWLDKGVVLHEFGHAIGMGHEHQNPKGGIKWNEANVIKDLSKPPNSWNVATIRHNVLDKYSKDQTNGTEVDTSSIMMYPFPASWTMDGFTTKENTELSVVDRQFMASVYPKTVQPSPKSFLDVCKMLFKTEKELYAVKKDTLLRIGSELNLPIKPTSSFKVNFDIIAPLILK